MPVIITLVHGTWAEKSAWVQEGSGLREAFERRYGDSVSFRVFRWSGGNSFAARALAGDALRAFLQDGFNLFPDARHAIAAHSHGGNVTFFALRDENVRRQIDNVVCLSTPFITVDWRDFGKFMRFNLSVLHWSVAIAIGILMSFKIGYLSRLFLEGINDNHPWIFRWWLLLDAAIVLITWAAIRVAFMKWMNFASRFKEKLTLLPAEDLRLLVIRATGDEASTALTTTQFLGWLATKTWTALSNIPEFFRGVMANWRKWAAENRKKSFLLSFVAAIALFGWNFHEDRSAFLLGSRIETVVVLFVTVMILTWWIEKIYAYLIPGLLLVPTTIVIGPLVLPLLLILSLTLLPFSPLAVFLIGPLQITVESTPPGRCTVFQLPPSRVHGLMHSSTYENATAIEAIVDWVMDGISRKA